MLGSSSIATDRPVDLRAITDPDVDAGVPGGPELTALARAATGPTVIDAAPFEALTEVIGRTAAIDAAAVAAGFESFNRVVDGTGLPISQQGAERQAELIDLLGLDRFPHAGHLN